jgi:hypothetical protein
MRMKYGTSAHNDMTAFFPSVIGVTPSEVEQSAKPVPQQAQNAAA